MGLVSIGPGAKPTPVCDTRSGVGLGLGPRLWVCATKCCFVIIFLFPFLQYYKTVPPRRQISYRSPVPGRLLPGYADASSHDTGLDRLRIENTVSKIETAAANKALTLAGFSTGSTSRAYNDDTVLVKSPSEPFSIKELESFETHFTTTTHSIQESAEAVECSDTPTISEHTVQQDNVQEQPETDENTGLKQQRGMTAQVLEIKPENKNSPTMADNDDELYDDITVVKQQLQDIKPSPSPVPGDPCTIPTQEEHQVVNDHQAPDDPMQMPTAGVEAEDTQSIVGDVVARSSPVPSKRNPPTKSPVPKPRAKKRSLSSPAPSNKTSHPTSQQTLILVTQSQQNSIQLHSLELRKTVRQFHQSLP